jgi:class 3 adenylate cyclase
VSLNGGEPASTELFLKPPASARFVTGSAAEAEALFGAPLPNLPPLAGQGAEALYYVRFHPLLGTLLRRFLQGLLKQVAGEASAAATAGFARQEEEYETALGRTLRAACLGDRRTGLANLFWLAHSQQVAEALAELRRKAGGGAAQASLAAFLASFYARVDQAARASALADDPELGGLRFGGAENASLITALTEDGLAFVEPRFDGLQPAQLLEGTRRYRLGADIFAEIESVLVREAERRLREGEPGIVARVTRELPGFARERLISPATITQVALSGPVMTYLFADAWTTGQALLSAPRLRAEAARRRPAEIMESFLDVVDGLKRFEILCHVRERVQRDRGLAGEIEEPVRRGARAYEFLAEAQVLNNAVQATVLFLDLRGFTKTSEGQISEGDLTRELYTVFDAFVPIVRAHGGVVDKYLGDGMMVTFGVLDSDPEGPVKAVRTAVRCQEALARLRAEGRSDFRMGVSIHYGRVYLARFLEDEEAVQTTVIGRNVNLAGRLSSAQKKPIDDDVAYGTGEAEVEGYVSVDAEGRLFNEGIVLSRATLVQLESILGLHAAFDGESRFMEYVDDAIQRRVLLRYVGDAKFKGVRASFPIFQVRHAPVRG